MEITYHLTYWETVYFTYYQTFRNRILQVWVAILLLFLGYITFNALRFQHSLLVKILVSAVILFAGLAIFGLLLSLEVLVNCYINRKRIQAACHLSISELGLVISQQNLDQKLPTIRSEVAWVAVEQVRQTRRAIMLYLTRNAAIVVPRRAFQDPQTAAAFYSFAHASRQRAKTTTDFSPIHH